jgi:hypothetical protein
MKLGKLPARKDHRTLRMARYLTAALPPAPAAVDWTTGVTFPAGMMLNDQLGDCTCAAIGHAVQVWTAAAGEEVTVPDAVVLGLYEAACGYNPADPSTDQGGVELDVLNYVRDRGTASPVAVPTMLSAFVACQPENREHIKQAIHLFGGAYIGLALPLTAQGDGDWTMQLGGGPSAMPGSWGGHAVFVPAYDADGLICITWGVKKRMSWDFWDAYCDEAYALLSPLWKVTQPGFDVASLTADLGLIS